jgi:hypothetical protein
MRLADKLAVTTVPMVLFTGSEYRDLLLNGSGTAEGLVTALVAMLARNALAVTMINLRGCYHLHWRFSATFSLCRRNVLRANMSTNKQRA